MRAIGIGAGGHAKVLLEIVRAADAADLAGLLDADSSRHGQSLEGVRILGGDELLPRLRAEGVRGAFIAFASVGDAAPRERAFAMLRELGFVPLTLIHPRAMVSASAVLGEGAAILAGAIINAHARLAENVIINSGAIVEHDCRIGAGAHVATGAMLAGGVVVGQGAHIGIGAVIRQCLRIGDRAVVGAGAVVVKDVPDGAVVIGNPAVARPSSR